MEMLRGVKKLAIKTNEELMMAEKAVNVLNLR